MTSILAAKAPGTMCQGKMDKKPTVKVVIRDQSLRTYGMIAYGFSITEAESAAVMPSIGKNLFVYCTNSAPVQIVLKGILGEIDGKQQTKKFPDFYKENRVGNGGKILKITIDNTAYHAVLMAYNRVYSTTPAVVDECSLTFLAVRQD